MPNPVTLTGYLCNQLSGQTAITNIAGQNIFYEELVKGAGIPGVLLRSKDGQTNVIGGTTDTYNYVDITVVAVAFPLDAAAALLDLCVSYLLTLTGSFGTGNKKTIKKILPVKTADEPYPVRWENGSIAYEAYAVLNIQVQEWQ